MDGFELRVVAYAVGDDLRQVRVGDERILEIVPIDVGGDAVSGCDGLDLLFEAFFDQLAVGFVEVAHRALEARLVGHDVPDMAAVQLGDGQHERMERRDVAAHDGLQCEDHRGERLDRAGSLVWIAGVGSGGVQGDVEFHAAGHHRFGADRDLSGRVVGIVVRADSCGHVGEQAGVDHGFRAEAKLFGRLEQQFDGSFDAFAALGEPERGAEHVRHVQVMTATVHDTVVDGRERQSGVLLDGQAVDVGAQCDARSRLVAADKADNAGFQRIVEHFDVVRAQQFLDVGACLVFLEAAFGVRVQVVSDFDDLRRDLDMFAHG